MGLAIGVDIGGTKVAAGVVDPDGHILARLRRDTRAQDPDQVEDVIADCILQLAADHQVEAAGLGAAGFVDAARSTVLFAPTWPGATSRCGPRSSSAPGCRWWSRTTPTPPPGPRPASGPAWAAEWSWPGSSCGARSGRRPRSAT